VEFISTPPLAGLLGENPAKSGISLRSTSFAPAVNIRCGLLKTIPIYENNYKIYSSKDAFLFLPLYQ
jgi:hypothetical protein